MSAPPERRVDPKLLALLGTAAVVALLFFFVISPLVLGGDDPGALPVPVSPRADAEAEADADDDEVVDGDVPESLGAFNARDPFQQLVTAEGGSGEGSTPAAPNADAEQPADDVQLRMTGIRRDGDDERAEITVDGTDHEPVVGDTFGDRFRLVDIAEDCATLAVGDDDRLVLCTGEDTRA